VPVEISSFATEKQEREREIHGKKEREVSHDTAN